MNVLTIDQSMASCAFIVLEGKDPVFKEVLHTTGSDNAKDWQRKFEYPVEQMRFIAGRIAEVALSFKVDHVVLESLSFGSAGNATRDLAGLFFVIQSTLIDNGFTTDRIHTVAPTSVKSWARNCLPEEIRGTKGSLIKMGKDEMIQACKILSPNLLDGYTKSGKNGGSTDLADAFLIGQCFIERFSAGGK